MSKTAIAVRVVRRLAHHLSGGLRRRWKAVGLMAAVFLLGGAFLLVRGLLTFDVSAAGVFPVEVSVQDLRQSGSSFTLTLKETRGNRRLAMSVAATEAIVIARHHDRNVQADPTQAYDLMRDAIQQMGGKVDRVIIHDADQPQYFAQAIFSTGEATRTVRARPGEAIALALRAGAPIFVEDRVLDRFGQRGSS